MGKRNSSPLEHDRLDMYKGLNVKTIAKAFLGLFGNLAHAAGIANRELSS